MFTSRQQGMGLLRVSLIFLVCLVHVLSVETVAGNRNRNGRKAHLSGASYRPVTNPGSNNPNPNPNLPAPSNPNGSSPNGQNGHGPAVPPSAPQGAPIEGDSGSAARVGNSGFDIPIIPPNGFTGGGEGPAPAPLRPEPVAAGIAGAAKDGIPTTSSPLSTEDQSAVSVLAGDRVRADIPDILLERRRSPLRGISLPGPLKAFVVSMLHVSFIPRTFPKDFAASWVKKESPPNASERAVQVALLQQLLHAILEVYDHPEEYEGPPIKDFSEYMSIVSPTEGDPYNSVQEEFDWMLSLLSRKEGLNKARRVNLNEKDPVKRAKQFANPDVRVLAQEREHLQHVYLKATLRSVLAAGTDVSPASYVIEVLIGAFVEALIRNPTSLTADIADTAAEALDGKPLVTTPQGVQTEQVSRHPVARALRQVARLIRSASDYKSAEAAFVDFIRTLTELKGDSLSNVIVAFETALKEVVDVFKDQADALVRDNEMYSSDRQKERQTAILKLLMQRYPMLQQQDVLKNIILDLLVVPVQKEAEGIDNGMMDVVLSHSGPMLTNLLQRSGNLARSGGFLKAVTERLQNANRPIPLPALRKVLQSDPNKYFDGNIPFEIIPDTLTQEQLDREPHADCVDPRVRGAGKFYLNYVVIVDGKRRRIKVQRPGVLRRLDDDHEIFRYLAPEIGQYFLPRSRSTDRNQIASRMQRQVDVRYHALMMEIEADQTARFQRDAHSRFDGRSVQIQTEEGPAEFVFRVPYVEDAVPGSLLLLMDEVRNIVDVKDFVSRYPGLASHAAEALYDEVFQQLVWLPLEQAREFELTAASDPNAVRPRIYGMANRDSHAGNILVTVDSLPHDGGFRVGLNLIDWGLTSTVSIEDLDDLLALGFGAGINDGKIVGEMLWSLSNLGRVSAGPTRSRDRARELAAQKAALMNHVRQKVRELKGANQYWGPAEWIYHVWIYGLADFPPSLSGLADVNSAIDDTMTTFYGMDGSLRSGSYQGEELHGDPKQELDLNVINRMEERGTKPALAAAYRHFGPMVYVKGAASMIGARAKSCAIALASRALAITPERKYVDPND